ncbi:MAG: dihydroorotate dehydrogenase (quinone) [Deltaproteobacteria bacterium]|nr:dihydroorotate dehydrogenase (quinone) [Deltaproteobacteria bacterium]
MFQWVRRITPRPQLGNPRPRLSRIPEKRALLNRMGFNNDGAEIIAEQLKRVRDRIKIPVGVNLGKNRDTPNPEAIKDYEILFKAFEQTASYFVINISSPNTPGLRDLQSGEFVQSLGARILHHQISQPVFIKLAPDIETEDLRSIGALCGDKKPYTGLILTNTISTDLGGLSGYPLKGPSTALLRLARTLVPASVPIISVGGIETAEDVMERFTHGANAVQLYSALIYSGPGLPGHILRELQSKMRRKGIRQLTDLRQY